MSRRLRTYRRSLQQLSTADSLASKGAVMAILSGSSSLEHAELSEMQQAFLADPRFEKYQRLETNFPYNQGFRQVAPRFPQMLEASWHNCLYYVSTLCDRSFREELKRHLQPLMMAEEVVIITQSSGLNMLSQVLEQLVITAANWQVIAVGPVAYQKVRLANLTVIKGRQDPYSKYLDRQEVDYWVTANHFNYLAQEEVKELIHDLIQTKN